jgi:hypothetical protein
MVGQATWGRLPRCTGRVRPGSGDPGRSSGSVAAWIGSALEYYEASPVLHEREARHHGLRYLYRTIDIDALGLDAGAAGELVRTARRLGYTGLNITLRASRRSSSISTSSRPRRPSSARSTP